MDEEKKARNDLEKRQDTLFDIEDIEFEESVFGKSEAPKGEDKAVSGMRTGTGRSESGRMRQDANRRIGEKPSLEIPAIERRQRRQMEERNLAPRQNRAKKTFWDEYGRYLICGAIAIVLVIFLVVVGLKLFRRDKQQTGDSSSSDQSSFQPSSEELNPLEKDTVPEVNTLMSRYYQALLDCDLDTLYSLVEDDSQYTIERLQKQSEYIENYENIVCYTKSGLNEGEYVLYVYSEIKFANIETAAPQLNHYYINRDQDGSLQIANGTLSNEKVAYMGKVDNEDDVLQLIDDVYQKLKEAMESDEKLNNLVQMLNDVPQSGDESSGSDESSPEDTTADVPSSDEPSSEPVTEPSSSAQEPSDSGEDTFYVNGELFYRADEIVYAKEQVRVRGTNSMENDDNVVGKLEPGDYVRRTGYSENWSQIEYNGYTAYVYKGYLTLNKPE